MTEEFEMLPFGGKRSLSGLERQIARGGTVRGSRRSPVRPMAHHGKAMPRRQTTGYGPHASHGARRLRPPYGWPYWAPAYWGWGYPGSATVSVSDDDGAPHDGTADNADDAPEQGETPRMHRAGCGCAACSRPVFDVLPFTVTQLAAFGDRHNWRSRRS